MQFKHLSLFALSAVTALVLISTGCKKSNNNSNSSSVSATVGTTSFSGANTQAIYSASSSIAVVVSYSVSGKDTTGFFLTIPTDQKVGKAFSADSTFLDVQYVTLTGTSYDSYNYSGHAVMTINQLDTVGHKINGVFTATAYNTSSDSTVITNGKFSTTYTVQ